MFWSKDENETVRSPFQPFESLLGNMRGMVVKYHPDLPVRRVVMIHFFQKFSEFTASVTISDQSMHVAVMKIKPGQEADCPETPVFVVSCPGRVAVRHGGEVSSDVCDGLNPRFLIVGHGCLSAILILFTDQTTVLYLLVNEQNLGHLLFKFRVPSLQVVRGLMGLDLILLQNPLHSSFPCPIKGRMAGSLGMGAYMFGQLLKRPLLTCITVISRFGAGQGHHPGLVVGSDDVGSARPRQILEGNIDTATQCLFDAQIHCGTTHSHMTSNRALSAACTICQENSRSRDTVIGFGPRDTQLLQLRYLFVTHFQLLTRPFRCHPAFPQKRECALISRHMLIVKLFLNLSTSYINAWDVLCGAASDIGKRVVVIGGGATGCETALLVANQGALTAEAFSFLAYHSANKLEDLRKLLFDGGRQVTIIEIAGRPAANIGISSRWPLLKSLKLMGVSIRTNTRIVDAREGWIDIETENGMESIQADTFIVATGSVPVDELLRTTRFNDTDVRVIGDAGGIGKISDAVREGFRLAINL